MFTHKRLQHSKLNQHLTSQKSQLSLLLITCTQLSAQQTSLGGIFPRLHIHGLLLHLEVAWCTTFLIIFRDNDYDSVVVAFSYAVIAGSHANFLNNLFFIFWISFNWIIKYDILDTRNIIFLCEWITSKEAVAFFFSLGSLNF
jgi:hypothetical protein